MDVINAIGRRKTAVARVYLNEGKGKITVNNRDCSEYFQVAELMHTVKEPLITVEALDKFDIKVNLKGGGIKGQAEAVKLAIARALVKYNPEFRPPIKAEGYLTRDSRIVERKKPGQPKARKRFQFSKR